MTMIEIERAIDSRRRIEKRKAQEQASFDYILADMIGKSIARIYSASNKMPAIEEVYPALFDAEEKAINKQEQQARLSAIRFKQFALSYNKRWAKKNE